MAKNFWDLEIWKLGHDLLMKVYKLTSRYPVEEKYGLISQTRNSANSVIANIAESHGRYFFADKTRVLYISRGEVEETRSHLRVAPGLKYLNTNEFEEIDKQYEVLAKMVNSYIKSIKPEE